MTLNDLMRRWRSARIDPYPRRASGPASTGDRITPNRERLRRAQIPHVALVRLAPLATLFVAMLAVFVSLSSCGRPSGDLARTAEQREQPRFAVLSPALAVMLRDLGHEDRIVARHAYDLVLDPDLPVAGDLGRLDYEVLIGTRPTHVLIEWGAMAQPLPERLEQLASQRGFTIMRFELLTLDDIIAAVDRLEDDLPESMRGPDDGYWQSRMRSAWNLGASGRSPTMASPTGAGNDLAATSPAQAGRILLIAATSPVIGVTGPGSWHHQILEALGGTPAVTRGAPWMELSVEDVARLAPDGIILIQPRSIDAPETGWVGLEEVLDRLGPVGRLDIPAVRQGRVALIDDPLAHTPSTAMLGLTDQMASILHTWAPRSAATPTIDAPANAGDRAPTPNP